MDDEDDEEADSEEMEASAEIKAVKPVSYTFSCSVFGIRISDSVTYKTIYSGEEKSLEG